MHTLTDEDITREPTRLLDDARRGRVTLVTIQGRALLVTLPLDQGSPSPGALVELAATLYDHEQISLGRAAKIAGLSYSEMIDELGRRGIATIRLGPDELQREVAAFGT
jgi:predicted HTH domain antitoxin